MDHLSPEGYTKITVIRELNDVLVQMAKWHEWEKTFINHNLQQHLLDACGKKPWWCRTAAKTIFLKSRSPRSVFKSVAPYALKIAHFLDLYLHFRKHDVSLSKSLTILLANCTIIRTKMPASSLDRKWSFYNRMNNSHFCHCQQENQRSQIKLDLWFFYLDQISVLILSK